MFFFNYELSPVPTSLFHGYLMRKSNKSLLAKGLDELLAKSNEEVIEVPQEVEDDIDEDDTDSVDEFDDITDISSSATASVTTKYIIDGGNLLRRVVWDKNITFREIINTSHVGSRYIQCTVVFDDFCGGISTKDHEHSRRNLKSSASLDMAVQLDNSIEEEICPC